MLTMEAAIKHYLDPLRIYCRLRNLGLTKGPISSARLQVPFGIKIESEGVPAEEALV